MTDFKSIKQELYTTPIGVRQVLSILARQSEDEETGENLIVQDIPDSKIEHYIDQADSIIKTYLAGAYGASELNNETPYFLSPIPAEKNVSAIKLNGIIVASTAITEQWLVTFTSSTEFTVVGSVSGSQGSGDVDTDFTSTNSDIQIKAEDWVGDNPDGEEGDQIIIGVYTSKPIIRTLSSRLSACYLVSALYSEIGEGMPPFVKDSKKEVYDLLEKLVDPDSPISLTENNLEDINAYEAVAYNIDRYGNDNTEYADIDTDDIDPLSE